MSVYVLLSGETRYILSLIRNEFNEINNTEARMLYDIRITLKS